MQEYRPRFPFEYPRCPTGAIETLTNLLMFFIILLGSLGMARVVFLACILMDELQRFGLTLTVTASLSFGIFFWRRWKQRPWETIDRRMCLYFAATTGAYIAALWFALAALKFGSDRTADLILDFRLYWVGTVLFLCLLYEAKRKFDGQTEKPAFW